MKRRYRWDRETGDWVEKVRHAAVDPLAPMVMPDLPGYLSPCGTGWIEGRAARREDLKRNNCVEAGDIKAPGDGKYFTDPRNKRYEADYAKDFERDRRERYGERVLTDWTPAERERFHRGR